MGEKKKIIDIKNYYENFIFQNNDRTLPNRFHIGGSKFNALAVLREQRDKSNNL